jgi:hypothetical protein
MCFYPFEKWWKSIPLMCLDDDLDSIHLVESNELMQTGWKMTGFHDDAIQRILNLLGFCFGGEVCWGFAFVRPGKIWFLHIHSEDFWGKTWSLIRHIYFHFFRSPYFYKKLQQVAKMFKDSEIFPTFTSGI